MLVRIYTCQNATLLEISCHGSYAFSSLKVLKATGNHHGTAISYLLGRSWKEGTRKSSLFISALFMLMLYFSVNNFSVMLGLSMGWTNIKQRIKFATMLLHFVIPFNLICNMTMFCKSWLLTYWPHPQGQEGGGGSAGKIFATMLLHSWFPFYLICNMTLVVVCKGNCFDFWNRRKCLQIL